VFFPLSYQLTIVAIDGGDPPLSGTIIVIVSVLDINDNSPTFAEVAFETRVPEDTELGTVIFRASATDIDLGTNARLRYDFTDETALYHGDVFGIRPETGAIFTRRRLDYETQHDYTLYITASDRSDVISDDSLSLTGMTSVTVRVVDVNDNAPEIHFNFRQRTTTQVGGDSQSENNEDNTNSPSIPIPVFIDQSAPIGTFIAHVTVRDADTGENGLFRCVLTSNISTQNITELPVNLVERRHRFVLRQLYASEFVIQTADSLYDDSNGDEIKTLPDVPYFLTVYCVDNGNPQLTTESSINVIIGRSHFNPDDRDPLVLPVGGRVIHLVIGRDLTVGTPVFCSQTFINENSIKDVSVSYRLFNVYSLTRRHVQLNHTNSIISDDNLLGTQYLTIDSSTGIVSTKVRLDGRDGRSIIPCRIVVDIEYNMRPSVRSKSGSDSSDGRLRLVVFITEILMDDDELSVSKSTPVNSTGSHSIFTVAENSPSGTIIGNVPSVACIADDDVTLSLTTNADGERVIASPFGLDSKTGSLLITKQLDGEVRRNYTLAVYAQLPLGDFDGIVSGGCDVSLPRGAPVQVITGRTKKGSGTNRPTGSTTLVDIRGSFLVANVHIAVEDVNDNRPVVEYPVMSGHGEDASSTLQVPCDTPIGHMVTRVIAHDLDDGDNAKLIYRIGRSTDTEANKFDVQLTSGMYNSYCCCQVKQLLKHVRTISVIISTSMAKKPNSFKTG